MQNVDQSIYIIFIDFVEVVVIFKAVTALPLNFMLVLLILLRCLFSEIR
jgi:hypothetical protein